jgi:hypothetical protein
MIINHAKQNKELQPKKKVKYAKTVTRPEKDR